MRRPDPGNHRRDFYDPVGGPRRWYWAMPYGERYIWGVTAGIIKAMAARLYADEPLPGLACAEDAR